MQVGGRGIWRIGANEVEDYTAEALRRTAARIAADEILGEGRTPSSGANRGKSWSLV